MASSGHLKSIPVARERRSKLAKGFFTIIVLPYGPSKVKRFHISIPVFKIARVLLVILIIGLSFITYDYLNIRFRAYELNNLRNENNQQKIQLQGLLGKLSDLEFEMAKLREFDRKLRIITNLEVPGGQGQSLGMGGPSPEDDATTLGKARGNLVNQMHSDLDQLIGEARMRETSLNELHEYLLKQRSILASTPSIWPARGWVTSGFGYRTDPFTGLKQMHEGMDIANSSGTPVIVPADGVVVRIDREVGLGKVITINHGHGIRTRYGHLSEIYVGVGRQVKRGERIGAVGSTGRTTGPHLHYEVAVNGVPVNPTRYILN